MFDRSTGWPTDHHRILERRSLVESGTTTFSLILQQKKRGPCCRPPVTKVANDAQGWRTLTPAQCLVHKSYTPRYLNYLPSVTQSGIVGLIFGKFAFFMYGSGATIMVLWRGGETILGRGFGFGVDLTTVRTTITTRRGGKHTRLGRLLYLRRREV